MAQDIPDTAAELQGELKQLIVSALNLEDISPEEIQTDVALFGDGLGLDSIDALELGIAINKQYGIKVEGETEAIRQVFYSVKNLAEFILANKPN